MAARSEGAPAAVQQRSTMDWIKLGAGGLGVVLLVVFFLQNQQEVDVEFLFWEWNTGLIWALLASAILGALSAVAFSTIRGRARRKAENR